MEKLRLHEAKNPVQPLTGHVAKQSEPLDPAGTGMLLRVGTWLGPTVGAVWREKWDSAGEGTGSTLDWGQAAGTGSGQHRWELVLASSMVGTRSGLGSRRGEV